MNFIQNIVDKPHDQIYLLFGLIVIWFNENNIALSTVWSLTISNISS